MGFIKNVRIRNFRNLEDCTFEIRPLTLLLGPNGSGKSTFLKALLFLGKNINEEKSFDECSFDITNDIKLGSFEEIVTNGEPLLDNFNKV